MSSPGATLFPVVDEEVAERIRGRLPHVPVEFAATIAAPDIEAGALSRPGWPRPRYCGVPIPSTSLIVDGALNIIESDEAEWQRVLLDYGCDLCSEPVAEENFWLFGEPVPGEEDLLVRGIMHRSCWRSTAHWCVHIRNRLLEGTMCTASIPREVAVAGGALRIVQGGSGEVQSVDTVIAEYHVSRGVLDPQWPFRDW